MSSEKLQIVTDIVDRLKLAYKMRSDAELARFLGVVPSTISNWQRRGSIDHDLIFTKCNDLNEAWILTGDGPMRRSAAGAAEEQGPYSGAAFTYVPMVRGPIRAGRGILPDNIIETVLAFRSEWIARKGDPASMAVIKVTGDSMEPTLLTGDLVLVDLSRNVIDPHGGIYAIGVDDSIMIKRLQLLAEPGRVLIASDNPKYQPMEMPSDQVIINGKVIWYGRELER